MSESDLKRKMNPMKLIDAGADLLSNAVKSIKSGPSVTDRLSSFIKKDEATGATHNANFRISVATDSFRGDLNSVSYKFTLINRSSNTQLIAVHRSWKKCDETLNFVRSMVPKLEAPSAPIAQGRNQAIVAEERRKYIQTFVNAAIGHPMASKLKELQDLVGIHELEDTQVHEARTSEAGETKPKLRHVPSAEIGHPTATKESSPTNLSFGSSRAKFEQRANANDDAFGPRVQSMRGDPRQQSSQQQQAQPKQRVRKSVTIDSVTAEDRVAVESVFRVIDADGLGRIAKDEFGELYDALSETLERSVVDAALEEISKDGTFDKKQFTSAISNLSNKTSVPVPKLLGAFKAKQFEKLYASIGEGGDDRYDSVELQTLVFVLRVSGVRLITEKELEGTEITIPVSLPDFCELMEAVTAVLPFDELLKSLQKTRERGKLLQLVNRLATRANAAAVRNVREKIEKFGGGGQGGKCAHCDTLQAANEELQKALKELQDANDMLKNRVDTLTGAVRERDDQLREMADTSVAKAGIVTQFNTKVEILEDELKKSKEREDALLTQLCEAEAELEIEKNKAEAASDATDSDDGDEKNPLATIDELIDSGKMYFLAPMAMGSSERAPVVDLPGALLYTLPSDFRPLGLTIDMFVCTDGAEYISCRDGQGLRSCSLTLDRGQLMCPWSESSINLPMKKWVRVSCRFHWAYKQFDVVVDDRVVFDRVAMRDSEPDGVATLDVYPRNEVVVCYANMHFFR